MAGQAGRHEGRRRQAPPQHQGRDVAIEQRAVEEEAHQWWPADASSGRLTPLAASAALRSSFRRSRPASLALSQRATSTGWVLEARSSHQPSGRADPHAVDVVDLGAGLLQPRLDLVDDLELAVVGAVEAQLRRVDQLRQLVAHLGQALLARWPRCSAAAGRNRARRRSRRRCRRRRCGRSSRRPAAP